MRSSAPPAAAKLRSLRIIAGLDQDYEGSVELPDHGKLGMVFQEPRLLPLARLEQNVRLAAPEATDANLRRCSARSGLDAHRDHSPGELSLGQARRVALARASRWNPTSSCLTSHSCPARRCLGGATRARNRPSWSAPAGCHPAGNARRRGGDRRADRLFLLSRKSCPSACRGAGRAAARKTHGGGIGRAAARDRVQAQQSILVARMQPYSKRATRGIVAKHNAAM